MSGLLSIFGPLIDPSNLLPKEPRNYKQYDHISEFQHDLATTFETDIHVPVSMSSKTITLTRPAYDRLQALKRDNESLSELIHRLTVNVDPLTYAGSCPGLSEHVDTPGYDLDSRPRSKRQ